MSLRERQLKEKLESAHSSLLHAAKSTETIGYLKMADDIKEIDGRILKLLDHLKHLKEAAK